MRRLYYTVGGAALCVELPQELQYPHEGRLAPFRTDPVTSAYRCTVALTDTLDPPQSPLLHKEPAFLVYGDGAATVRYMGHIRTDWRNAHTRVLHRGNEIAVQLQYPTFSNTLAAKTLMDALGLEHLIARAGGFIFHCSYIDVGGKAVLFTAPSGTGKSTQADLWQKYRNADIINGDRAAVRICDGIPTACGIPFAGSSQYCKNRDLPIAAIVYLSQAPENTLRTVKGYEAFLRIWEGVSVNTWDKTDLELVSSAVQTLAAQVPVFHLCCTPDESAVLTLEAALRKLEIL